MRDSMPFASSAVKSSEAKSVSEDEGSGGAGERDGSGAVEEGEKGGEVTEGADVVVE